MYKASTCRIVFSHRLRWGSLATLLLTAFFLLDFFGATRVHAAPNAVTWPPIVVKPIADSFVGPVDVVGANDGTDRLFVVEKGGLVYIIEHGVRLETAFLDISDRVATCDECGLLGLAFPPNYAQDGYFFVDYTSKTDLVAPDTGDIDPDIPNFGDTIIARFQVTNDPNLADADSEDPILVINQPANNHNGGHILFGPDEYLYIGMGDGGGGGDTYQNGQDPASLHGKILRIAVSGTNTYTVPADNPFVNIQGYRDEIWAMGLRNPCRFDFDRATGDLYVADVGQISIEEVNHVAAAEIGNGGMNFGWKIMEGDACYPPTSSQSCNRTGLTEPVATYAHDLGNCSVTGGYVYAPPLPGQPPIYLYADYCTGTLWGLQKDGETWESTILEDFPFQVTTFGEDVEGNVYFIDYAGTIYQIGDPIRGLTATNNGPNAVGNPIEFTATVTEGAAITYTWDFGDPFGNNVGEGITSTHSYTTSGLYTVTVTATNTSSVVSATTTVFIADALVEVLGNSVYAPEDVTIPFGGSVIWMLRGGTHSVTADDDSFVQPAGDNWPPFVQTFTTSGVHPYHCSLHGADGGSGMSGSVTVDGPPPPITELTADNDGPKEVNDPVALAATVTGGTGISYSWDFGDGGNGSGATPNHAYTESGVYTATVIATNLTNSMSATTTVYVGDAVVAVTSNAFTPRDVTIPVGGKIVWVLNQGSHSVTADDNSFEQPTGSDWPPFVQTFNTTGLFPYHCTVHGAAGGIDMAGSVSVESPPPPITGLTASNDSPKEVDDAVTFTAAVTGGTEISYSWDFGDGNRSSGITTTHPYSQAGIYTATVTASNLTNSMTATTTVDVGDVIIYVKNNAYEPSEATIQPGDKVIWVLQEGSHSVTADDGSFAQPAGSNWPPFMHEFDALTFSASASSASVAYDYYCTIHGGPGGNGMSGSVIVETAPSAPDPIGGLTAANDGPKVRATPVSFTAAITGGTEISYTWDFGDPNGGNVGTGITTTHTYTQSGIYTATVLATNASNSMSATTTVYVGDAVVAVTSNAFTPRDITIPVGGKVVWMLRQGFHSVTADDDSFEQPAGGSWPPFVQSFTESGVNPYYCSVHGAPGGNGMAGSVTVGPPVEDKKLLLPNIRKNEE